MVEVLEGISAATSPFPGSVLIRRPTTRGRLELIKDNSKLRPCCCIIQLPTVQWACPMPPLGTRRDNSIGSRVMTLPRSRQKER